MSSSRPTSRAGCGSPPSTGCAEASCASTGPAAASGPTSGFADEAEQLDIMRQCMFDASVDIRIWKPQTLVQRMSVLKNMMKDPGSPEAKTAAVHAAVEALRAAVDLLDAEPGRDAAAAAWHAASVVRLFCLTYGGAVTGVRVNEDSFVVIAATVPGDDVIDVTLAVGPDATCACKVSTADGDRATAAPDVRAFEQVLAHRLGEVGARPQTGDDRG